MSFGIDQRGSFAVIPFAQTVGAVLVKSRGIVWSDEFAGVGLQVAGVAIACARGLGDLRAPTGR